jgi:tRNA dimethylallyltransferase
VNGPVVVLGGPTASGKTALAIALAQHIGAEIVNADSRQVYAGMAIGTAAPSAAERAAVPHHLVGFLDPHERYSAARFVRDALAAIDDIQARGKRAIVAGGTGFYLRALCGDVTLGGEPERAVRDRLAREARTHPPEVLHDWLAALAPARAADLAPGDGYRVVRALEAVLAHDPSLPPSETPLETLRSRGIAFRKFVLRVDPAVLAARIGARTDEMLAAGLVAEAMRIGPAAVAADAVGYREAFAYLDGFFDAFAFRDALARNTRRYAKRQATWFRTEPGVEWIDAADPAAALAHCLASLS